MHRGRFLGDIVAIVDDDTYEAHKQNDMLEVYKIKKKGKLLEHVPCPICATKERASIGKIGKNRDSLSHKGGQLFRCANCSVIYAGVRYSKEASKYLYLHYLPSMLYDRTEEHSERLFELLNRDLDLIEKYTKRGILLDIGTASGAFLVYARTRGWKVQATELSAYCKDIMKAVFNIDVLFGELEELNLEDNKYQCISMRHTLEHIRKPVKELGHVHRALKDDGVLFVSTPEFAKDIELLKEHHMLPYHIVNYTRETLDYLLKLVGFKIVHYNSVPGDKPGMAVVAKKVIKDD